MSAAASGDLPPLRDELSLHAGPAGKDGTPSWTIRDPVRNRYFRISWPAFEILTRWGGQPAEVAAAVAAETTLQPEPAEVEEVARFLAVNQLLRPTRRADTDALIRRAEAERSSWASWLLHHYLFFRVPLVRPDAFLAATLPVVRWLGAAWFRMLTLGALLIGLLLVQRQWDYFVATLVDTFTLDGLLSYGLALVAVKVVHELAHGYTARRFGCQVPTMGVAFLVLWPMLYTDVNEAWTLRSRRQRLWIGGAGMLAELSVAAWATLAWTFLPEGPLKQAAFVLAALTWVSSLAINASPFMRFDGYFLLMDALEIPNLHTRSFALARWWLRERLFGLGDPAPEPFPPGHRRALIAFAIAVWLYRLVLFLGIAVLVYHFFVKAVGVVLFAVEIAWFILLPIWREVKTWGALRGRILAGRRVRWTAAGLGLVLVAGFIPWQGTVRAPAVVRAATVADLYLPAPARLVALEVAEGQPVTAGDVLMRFDAPDLALREARVHARLEGTRAELRAAQLDATLRERVGVLREDIRKAEAELDALAAERARLVVVAPVDGLFLDPLPDLAPGDWLSPRQRLGLVRGGDAVAVAYVSEDDLARLRPAAAGRFIADGPDLPALDGVLARVDASPVTALEDDMLASFHGGPIAALVDGPDILPEQPVTRVVLTLDTPPPTQARRGVVLLDGDRRSLFGRLARSIAVVLVREWGV